MASLLRTAEELRIKGLAEVSWNDENGDSRRTKNKTHNIRNLMQSTETAVTTAKPVSKRHSFSSSNSNQMNSNEVDPLAEASGRSADESVSVSKLSGPNQFLLPTNSPQRNNAEESSVAPVKKKRGRPPLDDDFDSYSTPKIAHVESSHNNFDAHTEQNAMYDDNSHGHSPTAILEQSMEVNDMSMSCENDDPTMMQIQPKLERPDTPDSPKQDYYDENDYKPDMYEPYDSALSSQVSQSINSTHLAY